MRKKKVYDWFGFYAPKFYLLALIVGFITRIILLFHPLTVVSFSAVEWLKIFLIGPLNDIAFATIALVPAFLIYSFLTDAKYRRPFGAIIEILLLALTAYVFLFNDITDEYGGPLPRIVKGVLVFFLVCFSLKLFIPGIRKGWRKTMIWLTMMVYACCVITNAFSEVVFWSEFGVRYNFIAVDYLVYTHEVIGNIFESYPMVPMILAMLAVSGIICWFMTRKHAISESGIGSPGQYILTFIGMAAAVSLSIFWLHWGYRNLGSANVFATQLQENGCWDFLEAFTSNELDYEQFYSMLPEEEATAIKQELCNQNDEGVQEIRCEGDPIKKNIVLITIESMSADFMATYGDTRGITPYMDSLVGKSLVFDNLYATGNRTVRGLEAVTLCIPPSSGESIVKRPDNGGLFSTGSILEGLGYSRKYIYGGDSYFDNMGAFYGGNGYEIVDKKTYEQDKIIFANIWGTSDEDTYREALKRFDADAASGTPFFAHIMTISNHRPYTYPEGRIEYDGNPMSRAAAVKYTDYAIGKFIEEAKTKPWFENTVFVIMADHCASSAGKTSLPLDCYHIPAIIYAPGFIEPQRVAKTCSQIDVMPTLFKLLNFSYDSKFYGQDILDPDFKERAFMATYQDLGYFADGVLTVLSPVRMVRQFKIEQHDGWQYDETLAEAPYEKQLLEAQAFYQRANIDFSK